MKRRSQFSKSQTRLLNDSLKKMLGYGLLSETRKSNSLQSALILDALNLTALNNSPNRSINTANHHSIKSENKKLS